MRVFATSVLGIYGTTKLIPVGLTYTNAARKSELMLTKCTSTPPSNVCGGAAEAVESARFVPAITAISPGARGGKEEAGSAALDMLVMVGTACPKRGLTEKGANVKLRPRIKYGK
jgi:hypothetical protein